jgi:hypothetical protein
MPSAHAVTTPQGCRTAPTWHAVRPLYGHRLTGLPVRLGLPSLLVGVAPLQLQALVQALVRVQVRGQAWQQRVGMLLQSLLGVRVRPLPGSLSSWEALGVGQEGL